MRYVNHKFGRACVHRPRREEGERRERKGGGREREGTKGLRRDTRRTKGGLDATRRGGEEKKQVWVLKNAEERNVRVSRWWMSHAHGFSF